MLPILIRTHYLTLYSYPLFLGLAWGLAYNYCLSVLSESKLTVGEFRIFFVGNFLLSWIGAKTFFLFFSAQQSMNLYLTNSNFWLGGGFVFYGGLVFCLLYTWLFLGVRKKTFAHLAPFLPALPLAHAVGRLGCLLAGCCFGAETTSFFSVHIHDKNLIPVQLLESSGCLLIAIFLMKKSFKRSPLWGLMIYSLSYSVLRFLLEFLRADEVRGSFGVLSSSQWVSLTLFSLGLYFFFRIRTKEQSFS